MSLKLKGFDSNKDVLVDPSAVGGANVVIANVPCEGSVYIAAAVVMQANGTAKNALADSLANSNVIGTVESKPTVNTCNIRVLGITPGIFTGLDVSKEYYLSDGTPGLVTTTIPTASGHVVLKLGQPYSATEFLMSKGQRTVRL